MISRPVGFVWRAEERIPLKSSIVNVALAKFMESKDVFVAIQSWEFTFDCDTSVQVVQLVTWKVYRTKCSRFKGIQYPWGDLAQGHRFEMFTLYMVTLRHAIYG
mmetsp:Transcript_182/g.481  ORF Transcript_182/g.481 Transcript_182/m.481 type:complete len:104 (+) Transcript_182:2009-2320(+)